MSIQRDVMPPQVARLLEIIESGDESTPNLDESIEKCRELFKQKPAMRASYWPALKEAASEPRMLERVNQVVLEDRRGCDQLIKSMLDWQANTISDDMYREARALAPKIVDEVHDAFERAEVLTNDLDATAACLTRVPQLWSRLYPEVHL